MPAIAVDVFWPGVSDLEAFGRMTIPTEANWRSEQWNIDTPHAYKHFYGKSLDDAFALFVENSICYQEDIMFMPLTCFRYYVLAYTNYLLSESSRGDSDGANCFFGIVDYRNDDIRGSSELVIDQIVKTLKKLKDNQKWYDADEDIYESFQARAATCLQLIQAEPNTGANSR